MKNIILMTCFLCVSMLSVAQMLDPATIDVRDSAGTRYETQEWQRLMGSGRYALRAGKDRKTMLLVKLTQEEWMHAMANIPKPRPSVFFNTGQPIDNFSEKDIEGVRHNLKTLRNKVVALNFWFINCGPCRAEMPELNGLVDEYKNNPDVTFLSISLDNRFEIRNFLKTTPFRYRIIDDGRYLASSYGVNLFPTHVVLDREGKVMFHTSGFGPATVFWVKKSIEAALANKPLE